jgi:hypothetical protein
MKTNLKKLFFIILILSKKANGNCYFLQTLHVPPCLAQCLQYLQFLQARQFGPPEQVAREEV